MARLGKCHGCNKKDECLTKYPSGVAIPMEYCRSG